MDWPGNARRIGAALSAARFKQVSVLCLPELSITGYGCEDMFYARFVREKALQMLQVLLDETRDITTCLGLPLEIDGALYNASVLVSDHRIIGIALKHYLARDGVYYEPRWFSPWPLGRQGEIELFGEKIPVGDHLHSVAGLRIGFEICEDAWVKDRIANSLKERGVDLILNPSASHFAFGKQELRRQLVVEGSKGVTYLYANLLGNDSGRLIYDGAGFIAQNGELLAEGDLLGFSDFQLTVAELGVNTATVSAKSIHRNEEFLRAVSLGLHDYMRRSRSKGFVVSLSGGVDSTVTTLLAVASFVLAERELGLAGLKERLAYWKEIQELGSVEEIVRVGVSCLYQATSNSGPVTRNAARELSLALGVSFAELSVSELVEGYLSLLKGSPTGVPEELNWQDHDLALQNIQARVRGPSVWLIANLKNALLLATSNRSEASVGYTTMDGDTCGGLSPIAGVDKEFLKSWLSWMEHYSVPGFGPFSVLSLVNEQQPTAELRPTAQTDEADLMPYAVLDQIEKFAIRDKLPPREILPLMGARFPEHTSDQLWIWIKRFHRLWAANQWKRERYAPAFHLDDKSVDPKTWCRFPILSACYEEELRD
jgi:NAD+ synthase (glutamine-hydrolysing)